MAGNILRGRRGEGRGGGAGNNNAKGKSSNDDLHLKNLEMGGWNKVKQRFRVD
jgi:hypothetical protein